ncbi:MAG: hemolysin III family protein [Dehalococcoidia bacterium]
MEVAAQRPLLRGVSHAIASAAALCGAIVLYVLAGSPAEYVSAAVYSTSLVLLFATSATYHTLPWRPSLKRLLKRLDHSMIFLLIAGSYTPFCLLVLDGALAAGILATIWALAILGVFFRLAWIDAPTRWTVSSYLALGWLAVLAAPLIAIAVPLPASLALAAGGTLYTAGALIYAFRRPDPLPTVFGYHEVFHLLVIAASGLHYAVVVSLFV